MLGIKKVRDKINSSKSSKDILYLTLTQIFLKPIQFVKSFVVAKYLGPEEFGILKSVELIQMLNKFGNLGFKAALIRDGATSKSKGNLDHVQELKNNAYTGELVLSIILFIAGVLSSLFFENEMVSMAIVLASIGFFSLKLFGMIQTELQLEEDFKYMSKTILLSGVANSVFIIATVPFYKIYAVLIVPILSTLFITWLAFRKIGFFFKLKINKIEIKNLLKVSIPLTFGSLAFGLFRYTERILIVSFLGLTAVGYFGFADTIAAILITVLLSSVIKVRKMKIYLELGKGNYKMVHDIVKKETLVLVIISLVMIIGCIIFLKIFIPIFLPSWSAALPVTIIFLLVVPLKLLSSYSSVVVKAPLLNKLIFEPTMQIFITITILIGVFLLKYFEVLTLKNFIIVDLCAYSILHFGYILYYYKHFVRQYL